MTVASFDLNVSPQLLFDLNEYPQEKYGGEATTDHRQFFSPTEDDGRVLRDLDLIVPLQQETEAGESIHGASDTIGELCLFFSVIVNLVDRRPIHW